MPGSYTSKEDDHLVKYIAKAQPTQAGRMGNVIYKALVADLDKWPWARTHSWQGWRDRYNRHREEFDFKIRKFQKAQGIVVESDSPQRSGRNSFTENEEKFLVKYLATYNPQKSGRTGNAVYKKLVENKDGKWNWSKAHTWQSWRSRYSSKQDAFDRRIDKYIEQHNIHVPSTPKRALPDPSPERLAKRQKTIDRLNTQEEQLANLVALTPEGPRINEDVKAKQLVSSNHTVRANGVQPTRSLPLNVKLEEKDQSSDDDDDDDGSNVPPGSEDYGGEIFDENAQVKAESSNGPRSGAESGNEGDEEDQNLDPADYNLIAQYLKQQHANEVSTELSNITNGQDVPSPPSMTSPPKLPPPKARDPNRHTFTLSSQRPLREDDDPFEDTPPPQKPGPTPPTAKRRPPALNEGPFGNRLNGTRSTKNLAGDESLTEDSDAAPEVGGANTKLESTWPPRRAGASRTQQTMRRTASVKEAEKEKAHLDVQAAEKPWQEKEKADLEAETAERRRREKGKSKAVEEDIAESESETELQKDIRMAIEASEVSALRDEVLGPTKLRSSRYAAAVQATPGAGPSRIPMAKRAKTDIFTPPQPQLAEGPRTINLRQELANRNLTQPARQLPRRPSSRISHTSASPTILSEEDTSLLQEWGIRMAVQKFSQEFGFTETVVQKLWNDFMSLKLLREVLVEMKESAEKKMNEWVEGCSAENVSAGSVLPKSASHSPRALFGLELRLRAGRRQDQDLQQSSSRRTTVTHEQRSAPGSSSLSNHRQKSSVIPDGSGNGSRSLEFTPLAPEDVSAAMEMEYEPLTGTRAGKYTRLARMGREDEALEREQRRVSSIAYSPRRELQHSQSGEQAIENKDVVDDEDVEDEEEIEIQDADEHEDENQIQDEEMLDVANEPRQTVGDHKHGESQQNAGLPDHSPKPPRSDSERPSGPEQDEFEDEEIISIHSGSVSPEDEGEVEALVRARSVIDAEKWQEVEHLFLSVNRHNVKDLREIEKDFNPRFMMRWIGSQVA